MTPMFSIIIPVYNVAPYLRECLDSILAAARMLESKSGVEVEERMVEIICVDDGSTDGSGEILDEWGGKVGVKSEKLENGSIIHSPTPTLNSNSITLRVIHQQNAGECAARNTALSVSMGDWLVFVDSDDVLLPDFLKHCAELIEHHSFDACFFAGGIQFVDEVPQTGVGSGTVVTITDAELADYVFFGQPVKIQGTAWSRLLRASIFKSVLYPVGVPMMGDMENLIDVLSVPAKRIYVDWKDYGYRITPNSMSRTIPRGRALNVVATVRRIVENSRECFGLMPEKVTRIANSYRGIVERFVYVALDVEDFDGCIQLLTAVNDFNRLFHAEILNHLLTIRLRARCVDKTGLIPRFLSIYEYLYRGIAARMNLNRLLRRAWGW